MIKENSTLNIYQKLLIIADDAGVLQKTKSGYSFKYVPEEDIQAKVTAGMQKHGLMLYQEITPGSLKVQPFSYERLEKKTGKLIPVNEFIVSADTIYTWVNVENPEEKIIVPWVIVGQMEDASQAFGAGTTYCNRYFLMKTLQLATSEADPDDYRSKQKKAQEYSDEKEAEAKLKDALKKVSSEGARLVKLGIITKEERTNVIKKNNGDNPNPASIPSIKACGDVLKEFGNLETAADITN
jgi:hypothetical protein